MATLYTLKSAETQVAELEQLMGMSFRRTYLIYNVPAGQYRGNHRHRLNHSVLICITGSVSVFIQSSCEDMVFQLTNPGQALHVDPSDWRLLYGFSSNCILLALASDYYSKSDYVHESYRPVYIPDLIETKTQFSLDNRPTDSQLMPYYQTIL